MGLFGSWAHRPLAWFRGRAAAIPAGHERSGRTATRRMRMVRARQVNRDFALWESEIAAAKAATTELRTVVGMTMVEVHQRPIQEVAVHLRRLRAVIDAMPADVSFVRWEGVMRAYDDFLWMACHELAIPTDLVTIGFGRARDDERRRLEAVLGEAGLSVR